MLLDSNIIIYAAEPGYDLLRSFIEKNNVFVSLISKVEVLGYHKFSLENRNKLETIFQSLPILPLSDEIVDKAIFLRQKRKMSLGDALIAATALIYNMKVVTANVKDFAWIENIEVFNPLKK
jgi:toxin FitB